MKLTNCLNIGKKGGVIFFIILLLIHIYGLIIHGFNFPNYFQEAVAGWDITLATIIIPYTLLVLIFEFKKYHHHFQWFLLSLTSWLIIPFPNFFKERICVMSIPESCSEYLTFNWVNGIMLFFKRASYYHLELWWWIISIIVSISLGFVIIKLIKKIRKN